MKRKSLLLLPVLFFFSCAQKKDSTIVDNTIDSTKEVVTSFIPVTVILQNQLADLDSLPVTILQIKTVNKKDDSAWLPVSQVKPLLQPFLSPVIDKENMLGLFKETKFNDQSTASVTFTYDPKKALPDSMVLRKWDVYFDPEKNAIHRVYIVKQEMENNIPVIKQLTWQSGKWAKIVTISTDKNAANPILNETKWIWDLND